MSNDESALRRTSIYWAAETTDADGEPQTAADPTFKLFSRTVESEEGEYSAEWEDETGIGADVAHDSNRGLESHEQTFNYVLQRKPQDTNGNPQDPLAYGYLRDIDGRYEATLTYLEVVERTELLAKNTVHNKFLTNGPVTHPSGSDPGAASKPSRTEIYGRGGNPDEPEVSFNPGDSAVVTVEAPFMFKKVRSYQLDQPTVSSNSYLHLRSSDAGDTGVAVDVETPDGATSETVNLDGADATTSVATASTYDNYRISVPDGFNGLLQVYEDDGSGTSTAPVGAPGQLLAVVHGASDRAGIESDSGVPMVGAGSYETEAALLSDSVTALGTAGSYAGSAMANHVLSTTVTCANNVEDNATSSGVTRDYEPGLREITAESTVYGETESVDKFGDELKGTRGELRVPTTVGDFVGPNVRVDSGGSKEKEQGQSVLQIEVGFKFLEPSDGSEPLTFVPN